LKLTLQKLSLIAIIICTVAACSTQKNKFLNRNWHAMNTYYNIIFNGNEAVQQGITTVTEEYPEDYWSILPVERLQEAPPQKDIFNTKDKQEEAKNPDFKRAEEKATKAIQKHSMFISGEEYNHQMDEAFLLLGKARYYGHRFIQAKDAFSYILNHYATSSEIVDAKIWTEKTNMRLKYYEMALNNLEKIKLDYPELEEEKIVHLNSTLAEAHILNENYKDAIPALNEAIDFSKRDGVQGRLLYIKAQLFDLLSEPDSAYVTYQKVIDLNRKSPRTYMIHARLEQLKNSTRDTTSYSNRMLAYQELIENRENRPFLDFVYFDIAEYHNAMDSIEVAIHNYNKSLSRKPEDDYLYSRNYLRLADIYFDKNKYKTAGAYYDSTLTYIDEEKREYRLIAKKRENLDDVIKYEAIAEEKDSILNLIGMSKAEQITFFEDYIEQLKEEAQSVFAQGPDLKGSLNNAQGNAANSRFGAQNKLGTATSSAINRTNAAGGSASYYFYNKDLAQKGLLAFKQTWGNIPLEDNWKYGGALSSSNEAEEEEEDPFENDPRYKAETYLAEIPSDEAIIDSLWIDRNFAYYQLGVIYKEKFKEYPLSKEKFENLFESDPEERLILPSIYNLYLIAEAQGLQSEKLKWRNTIINDYPDSEYALLLLNPQQLKESENNPLNIYKRLYKSYENQQYQLVITQADMYAKKFIGRPITPKLELLKAYAIAKVNGLEDYKEALNYVALTYPQSDEGKFAQQKYDEVSRNVRPQQFEPNKDEMAYKLVYHFDTKTQQEEFKTLLTAALEELELNFKITDEVYTIEKHFTVIDGLNSLLGAQGLAEKLVKDDYLSPEFSNFAISEDNYSTLQIYKNLEDYLNQLNK